MLKKYYNNHILENFNIILVLIFRSDHELCQQSKVIKFNTVEDLKGEYLPGLKYKEPGEIASEYNNLFQNESDCIQYKDTFIRRLKQEARKCLPIEEFLNTIKSDSFKEDNYVSFLCLISYQPASEYESFGHSHGTLAMCRVIEYCYALFIFPEYYQF